MGGLLIFDDRRTEHAALSRLADCGDEAAGWPPGFAVQAGRDLIIDGRRYDLSANQYPGAVHPQGFQFKLAFVSIHLPGSLTKFRECELEKSVFMVQGENTTVVQYDIFGNATSRQPPLQLRIRPLIAFRDYHSTTHENSALDSHIEI